MKVPIRYKSSDRYNAGTDVIYDDDSKLQYAPYVYATTASGDNGGSEDEEGEDSMVVHTNVLGNARTLDKNWTEIKEALDSGKFVYIEYTVDGGETVDIMYIEAYYSNIDESDESNIEYIVSVRKLSKVTEVILFKSSSPTGVLRYEKLT